VQGNFFERMWNVLTNLDETNYWNLALGLVSIAALLFFEIKLPRLPGALIVVLAAITVMWLSNLEDRGLKVAGAIPGGLPGPAIPTIDASDLSTLMGLAFGLFLLSYIEGVGAARTFASAHKYKIDANQELIANGAANISAGLFQGYNVGGSMSRSAVNDSGGAKSPAASLFAAIILAIVLLFLTKPFSYLPEATLAAVVLVAVKSLVKVPAIKRLLAVSMPDFLAALLTLLGVLTFGMLEGIIIGVLFSFLTLLKRVSMPHTSLLGRKPNTSEFVDVTRNPDAEVIPDTMLFRANSGLFYANAPLIKDDLLRDVDARDTPPKLVVIDMAAAPLVDLGAVDTLGEIKEELDDRGIDLRLAGVYGEVRNFLTKAGYADQFEPIVPDEPIGEVLRSWQHAPLEPASTDRNAAATPLGIG
jgi:MFS superfamily sulfate permease-like transporter